MKTRSFFFSLLLASAVSVVFVNCSGGRKDEAEGHAHEMSSDTTQSEPASTASVQHVVDASFQKQLADIFAAYLSLKEAFVSSDASKVKAEATATTQVLGKADMKLLSGAAHHDWMNYLSGMEASLKEIGVSADMEAQRKAFSSLSDNLYKAIKAYGLGGKTAYYEFCPMAFNNEGGYWLSDREQIRNPYFGDAMLTCGSVKETLK